MEKRPKLKVQGLGWETKKDLYDFEEARHFPYDSRDLVIVVEGKAVRSFEDLVTLADRAPYRDKTFLDVKFLEVIVGG